MKYIFLIIYLQVVLAAHAQTSEPCWFDQYQRLNSTQIQKAETRITDALRKGEQTEKSTHIVKRIPVVVHIIHNSGTENISAAQVQSQIDVLNEDFRKKAGTNGFGNGVDTRIEFCLARISPDSHCTDGIVRVQSTLTNHLTYQRSHLKQLSFWDNTRYLNMYVVKSINGNSGIAGYSSFPGGPPDEDGIVVRHNYFGRTGTATAGSNGRTTTHEISHWFGLYHTFNNGCGTDTCTDGDKVCDTPPAANPNYGCPVINSCSNDFPNVPDQVANYLDYSNDACKSRFTTGQKARMHATLETIRTVIWSNSNLTATGCDSGFVPPLECIARASFSALKKDICITGSISFSSNSLNNVTSLVWSFPGGTPAASTSANPTIVYNSTGTFPVRLVATNAFGSDTFEIPDYIVVSEPVVGSPNTWGDNFESENFPANGLVVENPDTTITWERTTDAAKEGLASVRIQNLINTNYGQSDALVLPRIDFTAFPNPIKMTFKWAYARSDANYSDELIVLVSNNCGSSWTQKFYRTGTSLATGPTQTTLFIPTASQWKSASIDLSTYATSNHVDIKIVNVTDGGNALYIDSLKVGAFDFGTLTGLNPAIQNIWYLFPNPTSQNLNLSSYSGAAEWIDELSVTNLLGHQVIRLKNLNQEGILLQTGSLPAGLYHILIRTKERVRIFKFLKQ